MRGKKGCMYRERLLLIQTPKAYLYLLTEWGNISSYLRKNYAKIYRNVLEAPCLALPGLAQLFFSFPAEIKPGWGGGGAHLAGLRAEGRRCLWRATTEDYSGTASDIGCSVFNKL